MHTTRQNRLPDETLGRSRRARQPQWPAESEPSAAAPEPLEHDPNAIEPALPIAPIDPVPADPFSNDESVEEAASAVESDEPVDERDDEAEPLERDATALRRYLRDMADVPVLRPREEFDRARAIEEYEIATWERLLGHRPFVGWALGAAERVLGLSTPDARRLARRAATASVSTTELRSLARRVGEQLRQVDLDRIALPAALAEVEERLRARTPRRGARTKPEGGRDAEALRAAKRAFRRVQREKNEFAQANLRLVFTVARRFRHGPLSLEDLVQEGNLGLLKAVDRFDHRRGCRFSTYATWWIRHAMQRAIVDKGRMVRVPVHFADAQLRVARVRRGLANQLGREPTADEVREASGVAEKKLELLGLVSAGRTYSLDRPMGDDEDDRRWLDILRDPSEEERSVPDALAEEATREALREELRRLKPMEAEVLRQRFGLDGEAGRDGGDRTLKAIGARHDLSRERIRQIEQQALRKLREALERRDLG